MAMKEQEHVYVDAATEMAMDNLAEQLTEKLKKPMQNAVRDGLEDARIARTLESMKSDLLTELVNLEAFSDAIDGVSTKMGRLSDSISRIEPLLSEVRTSVDKLGETLTTKVDGFSDLVITKVQETGDALAAKVDAVGESLGTNVESSLQPLWEDISQVSLLQQETKAALNQVVEEQKVIAEEQKTYAHRWDKVSGLTTISLVLNAVSVIALVILLFK